MNPCKLVCVALVAAGSAWLAAPSLAQQPASRDRAPLPGMVSNSKDPIKIDADKLEVFDREQKAVFIGNVVAVQGDSTLKASRLTVHYDRGQNQRGRQGTRPPAQGGAAQGGAGQQGQSISKIEAEGPVTVISREQVATGDSGVFDRVANVVTLTGNVTLSQGPNVTKGDRLVYDLNNGVARVETKASARVRSVFVPGSVQEPPAQDGKPPARAPRSN
jgi:lipopolysaccharide export system protein LptA